MVLRFYAGSPAKAGLPLNIVLDFKVSLDTIISRMGDATQDIK